MKETLFLLTTKELQNKSPEYLETIFSLGNGHLGVRATFPFYVKNKQFGNPGLFVNGFFFQRPIIYGERAYGYAKNHQTMAKLPSPRNIKIVIGGEDSSRGNWKFFSLESELNMSSGILNEHYDITTPQGKHFVLLLESFASQDDFSIYAQKISILVKEDISEDIHVEWIFEKPQSHHSKNDDPRVARHNLEYQVEEKDDHYVIFSSSSGKKYILMFLILLD